jgi:sn-glycerol 3-phosphate transport system permease protein
MMVERRRWLDVLSYVVVIIGIAVVAFPVYLALVASTQTAEAVEAAPMSLVPGDMLIENYRKVLFVGGDVGSRAPVGRMMLVSLVMAVGIAVGKIIISLLSAFAIVYFRFPLRYFFFWMIFVTLMLPIPVRIVSTYEVMTQLGWVNTYWGLTVPLMASATGTFLFRQFYQTIPDSLTEAAQLDGAGPMRFLWSILLPLSKANIAALFVILFVYGWNEYLWPLMITTTSEMRTAVVGVESLVPRGGSQLAEWNVIMAAAIMILLPPVAVIVIMQRWFVKGLIETEK